MKRALAALLLLIAPALVLSGPSGATVGGPTAPDGTEVQLDLPKALHLKNRGGSDGAGLCVFASCTHTGRWQTEPVFSSLFEFMFTRPGGGYPEKVQRMVAAAAKAKSLPEPSFVQIEGSGPEVYEVLKLACKTGRMPGVTYSYSPTGRYGGRKIAHMVTLVHADEKHWAILDNNYPGSIEWMSLAEFKRAFTGGGSGWAVILTETGGPPPPPKN